MNEHEHHRVAGRKSRMWAWIGGVVIVVAIVMVAFAAGAQWLEASRWDPLDQYPLQVVASAVDNEAGSAAPTSQPGATGSGMVTIYLDQEITTIGVKCVKSGEGVVTVTGVLSWVSDQPPGRIIEISRGGGPRGPGCISSTFTNPIPDKVRSEIDKLSERGVTESQWHLTGTETPVRADGETGVDRVWVSTTFRVVHSDAP